MTSRCVGFIILFLCFVKLNLAQISFESYSTISTGSHAEVVEIGDFNLDGLNDVVIGNTFYFDPANDYKLKIFIQDSLSGNFNPPITLSYTSSTERVTSICVSDLNQDGFQDIIVGAGNKLKIFYQLSNGGFNTYQELLVGNGVSGVDIGDLNHDSIPDLIVSNSNERFIQIFYQDPIGFNEVRYPSPLGLSGELKVADMNNDGKDDIALMSRFLGSGIHIFLQNSSGSIQNFSSYYPQETSWNTLNGFDTGDINNDGKVDMVASMGGNSPNAKMVIWNQHDSNGLIAKIPQSIAAYDIPQPVKIHDLNCDGIKEILTIHGGWQNLSVFEADLNNQFNAYSSFLLPYASHYNPYGMAIGDLNNDGKEDIAIADSNHGLVLLYNNQTANHINFTVLDSLIKTDTSLIRIEDSLVWDLRQTSWQKEGWVYFQTDSSYTNYRYRFDEVVYQENYYRSKVFCNRTNYDTIRYDTSYILKNLISSKNYKAGSRLDSINAFANVKVYPNPNRGRFMIQFSDPWNKRQLNLNLYDSRGRLIVNQTITDIKNNSKEIELIGLSEGEFTLTLSHKDQLIAKEKLLIINPR